MKITQLLSSALLASTLVIANSGFAFATEEINLSYDVNVAKAEEKPSVDTDKISEVPQEAPKEVATPSTANNTSGKVSTTSKEATKPAEASGKITNQATEKTKQFYTIKTASGKIFYLITNPGQDEAKFVTEVSEQDLLNLISINNKDAKKEEPKPIEDNQKDKKQDEKKDSSIGIGIYGLLIGAVVVALIIFKKLKGKKDKGEDFNEDQYEEVREEVEEDDSLELDELDKIEDDKEEK